MTSKILYSIFILIALLPWLVIQLYTRIPGDAAFLFSGMELLLQGHKMSDRYYDTNPPMSFLIYAPATILNYLGLSKHFSIQLYTLIFTGLSVLANYYFLQKWKNLSTTAIFVILSYYIGSTTILTYTEYAQKDHLIAIGLIPFILMQLSITQKHKTPSYILWAVALIYAPFILLKPHFGILPVALLIHRLYTQKNINILLDIDFLGLSLATIAYISFTFLYMPDYISEVLPATLLYYSGNYTIESTTKTALALILLGISIIFLSKTNDDKTDAKNLCETFAWLGTLSIIAFWGQNKGYTLHLFPTITLISIPIGLLFYSYIKEKTFPVISIIIALTLFYTNFAFTKHVFTLDQYKNSSIANLINEKAGKEPIFFETYTTNIISTINLYLPNELATRFPSLWFLVNFSKLTLENQEITWNKYGKIMAQDIEKFKPKLIAFIKYDDPEKGFLALFKNHKEFQEQWKNYKYDSEYTISKDEFNDILLDEENITYNVYLRQD